MDKTDHTYFDVTPHLTLFIDKDGRWYQNGAEIIHPGVRKQFSDALENKVEGGYRIRLGREVCDVLVEDTPFVILRVYENKNETLDLLLNDGSREIFEPSAFWINESNIPYTMVKNGKFSARFSRPAYYEIAKRVVFDENTQSFSIVLNGKSWGIVTKSEK
ncbi:MAG: hypothetical protein ACP5U1_15440 [Desulfomonilaceae bacterium]